MSIRVELKKIDYRPEQYDDKGELKTAAYFSMNLNIPCSPAVRELLVDLMLSGDPDFDIDISPVQGIITEVKNTVQQVEDKRLEKLNQG